jgi:diguanylate cyclase (GGDEF)-like protein/PAS domain S-box-containing protein
VHRTLKKGSIVEEIPNLHHIIKDLEDYKYAFDQTSIMTVTDAKGTITYVNDLFCKISKFSPSELIGKTHRVINSGHHSKQFFKKLWDTILSGEIWRGEIRSKAKDGSLFWVNCTIIPFLNNQGVPERFISIRTDITERKAYEEQVAYLAYYDELTSLPNRRKFNIDLKTKMETLQQDNGELSIIFLDLDRFKYINDTRGHTFGDYVLKTIVKFMKSELESKARLYRLGGDEFTIIYESSSYTDIQNQANRLLNLFKSPIAFGDEEFFLSLSIGISIYPYHGEDMEMLVKNADVAMYRAKETGGNRVEYYSNAISKDIQKKMSLENELRKAIKRKEFFLVYQPKINLMTRQIVGLEALIRWNHREFGLIPPSQFIPLAEKTGQIVPITENVIRSVCKDIEEWNRNGIHPSVAINISPIMFEEMDLSEFFKTFLQTVNIDSSSLELEITESAMINPVRALRTLKKLKELGLKISIDDFGTGYSSLGHLRQFPVDTLKIDISFIRGIGNSQEDNALVKTIIDIAHNLKLNVVAEGVETNEQLNFLSKYNCTEGQGYVFFKPMTKDNITSLL